MRCFPFPPIRKTREFRLHAILGVAEDVESRTSLATQTHKAFAQFEREVTGDPRALRRAWLGRAASLSRFRSPRPAAHTVDGLAFTVNGSSSAHTGTIRAARADAIKRVADFLSR